MPELALATGQLVVARAQALLPPRSLDLVRRGGEQRRYAARQPYSFARFEGCDGRLTGAGGAISATAPGCTFPVC